MADDAEMADYEQESDRLARGRRMMEMQGWAEGEGLGPEKEGVRQPLAPSPWLSRLGLGAELTSGDSVSELLAVRQGGEMPEWARAKARAGAASAKKARTAAEEAEHYLLTLDPDSEGIAAWEARRRQTAVLITAEWARTAVLERCLNSAGEALRHNLTLGYAVERDFGQWWLKSSLSLRLQYSEATLLTHDSHLARQVPKKLQLDRNAFYGSASPFTTTISPHSSAALRLPRGKQFYSQERTWDETFENAKPLRLSASIMDVDDPEISKLNAQVLEEPEEFENWEKLVRAAELQEGGLNRNSSPQAISAFRDVYDRFLARFPLFFGYWKKYADHEFAIAGTEAAEMVYERGVASIGTSVDLWANYCGFKLETSHDSDVIRDLFERGAESVGLDFHAHPFWDKYLDFEERLEGHDRIFKILERIIHLPLHQYARYFERYRTLAAKRPVAELAPQTLLVQLQSDIQRESGAQQKDEAEIQRELRSRTDTYHLEIFHRTQTETTKRWTYEQEIKRPYFHVTDLDEAQLLNWRKYLDFEEAEGDYARVKFLYERCLVTAANYDEFWLRYARWMLAQNKEEEVRNIYQRASSIFVPISRPSIRLSYAQYEESLGYPVIAADIHEAILLTLPNHLEAIISLANLHRRQHGVDTAIATLKRYIEHSDTTTSTRGALVSEWARLSWEIVGSPDEARKIWQICQQSYLSSRTFWMNWFSFEVKQPAVGPKQQSEHYQRVKSVYEAIHTQSLLAPEVVADMTTYYLNYLKERGGPNAMKEYMRLDQEVNGPASVRKSVNAALTGANDETGTHRQMVENGHGGVSAQVPQSGNGQGADSAMTY